MNNPETKEDRKDLVTSLGIPVDAEGPSRYIDRGAHVCAAGLAALVDGDVTERTWRHWRPAQVERIESPSFRAALQTFLSAGAGMGYSLGRFRSVCRSLPDPDPEGESWVEPFEHAVVAARNASDLRVFVRSETRDHFVATNAAPKDEERWNSSLSMMSDGLFYELGILLPKIDLLADDALAPTEFRIEVNDARLPRRFLPPSDRALVNDTLSRLALLGLQGEPAMHPVNGSECAIVAASDAESCKKAGLTTWDQMGYILLSISAQTRPLAGAFINRHLVEYYLDRLSQAFPIAVTEVRKALSSDAITQVLRALADEEISIRNLLRISEVLALPDTLIRSDLSRFILFNPPAMERMQCFREEPAFERRLFRVRSSLKRYISHKYTRGQNTLIVYLLDPKVEERLEQPLPLSRDDRSALLRALTEEIGSLPPTAQNPVILTTASVRLRLRREMGADFPRTAVLAYQELSPDMNIQPIARIEAPDLTNPS
jgi:DNA-binding transcriptional ArsR family regulator